MPRLTQTLVNKKIPLVIRHLLNELPDLTLAGGAIRAICAGEQISDFDLFSSGPKTVQAGVNFLQKHHKQARVTTSPNATTVRIGKLPPIQFITRWYFNDLASVIASFDFTIAQAATCSDEMGGWLLWESATFAQDVADRRLTYTRPTRIEDAAGSLLRFIKFTRRGYRVTSYDTIAALVARVVTAAAENVGMAPNWEAAIMQELLKARIGISAPNNLEA